MLVQRYTTPMVTVVCPVTKLHHIASLQSASSCNCTSCAGIVSLKYSNIPPPFCPILSFLNITQPSSPKLSICYVIVCPFKHTHLISALDVFLCIPLHLLSSCMFRAFFDKPPCPNSLNIVVYAIHWQPPLTVPRQRRQPPSH